MTDQNSTSQTQSRQTRSPFKDVAEFESELIKFSNKFKTTLTEHSRRISNYFEMSCYNMIIHYYENKGYTTSVENLSSGRFRFKCSPAGHLDKFSFIKLSKEGKTYRLYHNASVQSAHDKDVYTTPDVVVAKDEEPSETTDYYKTKTRFTFLPNTSMKTFCEAKHLVPFPELMISFIGTVNELKPQCIHAKEGEKDDSDHIAPSLMMSGSLSRPTERIAKSLRSRYYVNIFSDLFIDPYKTAFSRLHLDEITTLTMKGRERKLFVYKDINHAI